MVTDLFTSKAAEEFFRTEELLQLLKDHKDKKADNSRKIWTVLTFLIWCMIFLLHVRSERVGYDGNNKITKWIFTKKNGR